MPTYKYTGPHRVMVLPLARWVEPGETVSCKQEIAHPHFAKVTTKASKQETPDADN